MIFPNSEERLSKLVRVCPILLHLGGSYILGRLR